MTSENTKAKEPTLDELKVQLAREIKQFSDKWERKLQGTLVPGTKGPLINGFRNETTIVPLARLQMWVENQVTVISEQQRQSAQGFVGMLQSLSGQLTDLKAGELALDIKAEAMQRLLNLDSKALEAEMDKVAKERELEVDIKNDQQAGRKVVDRAAQDGDVVRIGFVGTLDGVEFPGGKSESYNLALGSGTFVPGLEEGIVGMKAGETKDIPVKFPDDYGSKSLAGKDTVFKVTVHAVKEVSKKEETSDKQDQEQSN